jgi:sporulation integral membrane protein YtvI
MIIIIGVLAVVILLLYLLVSRLTTEAVRLLSNLPEIYNGLSGDFKNIGDNLQVVLKRLPDNMQASIEAATVNFTTYLGDFVQMISVPTFEAAGNFARNVPGTLIAIIMCLLSAYFFTADRERIMITVGKHLSPNMKKSIRFVIDDLKRVVGGYFKAQFKIMAVVYVILVIGLLILKVNYAIIVGFFIAFLDMLPFFGTGTVLGPWAIFLFLSGDYVMAASLVVLYAITQIVRQVIQPKIVGDSIGMNPLAALFFMYMGYKFGSVGGMIIAVPIGMVLINLYGIGVFDNQVRGLKELVNDFNQFRKF